MDLCVAIPAEGQKVSLGIVPAFGSGFDMVELKVSVAAAELAGELIPPENLDHNLLLAPGPPHRISVLVIPAVFHA